MKKILLLTFLGFFVQITLNAQSIATKRGSELCSERKSQMKILSSKSANSPKHSFDVLNYSLNLDLMNCYTSPFSPEFSASNTIKFRVDTALNQINLNASNTTLQIDSVRLQAMSFAHSGNILTINLNKTYNVGEIVEVKIYYTRKNVRDDSFYAEQGWVYTDCEPEGARGWFPCWDKPSDKATVSLTAKVPLGVLLGSNGRLADSINNGTSITYKWVSRDPVATYLVVVTSRLDYHLHIENWTNPNTQEVVPVRFYYNSGENIDHITSIIGEMTTFFSKNFGDHPFEKNGFATAGPGFTWGGMENQTLTTLCRNCWGESLIAHEFAHQWFGDMVTCATWADIWLNEGFATWSEAFWNGHRQGDEAYLNEINANAAFYRMANPGRAISNPEWAVNTPSANILFDGTITYNKASCVVHQLRYVLGDSMFFKALKAYGADTTNFKYKSATTLDFKNKFEEVSGQQLDWFFDSWIYQPNHPIYNNEYYFSQLNSNLWRVNFIAKQTNTSQPYWQMPLELKIKFADNSDTLVRFFNSQNNQSFDFDFAKQPVSVEFDPNMGIVLKEGSTRLWANNYSKTQNGITSVAPNPFKEKTTIQYTLSKKTHVKIVLLDVYGKTVLNLVDEEQQTGEQSIDVNNNGLPAGIYFCRFSNGEINQSVKVILVK